MVCILSAHKRRIHTNDSLMWSEKGGDAYHESNNDFKIYNICRFRLENTD